MVAFVFIGQMLASLQEILQNVLLAKMLSARDYQNKTVLNDAKKHTGGINTQVFTRGQHQHIFQTSNSYSVPLIHPSSFPSSEVKYLKILEHKRGTVAVLYELILSSWQAETAICLLHLHHSISLYEFIDRICIMPQVSISKQHILLLQCTLRKQRMNKDKVHRSRF